MLPVALARRASAADGFAWRGNEMTCAPPQATGELQLAEE